MIVHHQGAQFKSLTDYVKASPQNEEFVGVLKREGKQVLERAREAYTRGTDQQRETAFQDLQDLATAMRAAVVTTNERTYANVRAAGDKARERQGIAPHADTNVVPTPAVYPGSREVLEARVIITGPQTFSVGSVPHEQSMSNVDKFARDCHLVAANCAVSMALSGPVGQLAGLVPSVDVHETSQSASRSSLEGEYKKGILHAEGSVSGQSASTTSTRVDEQSTPTAKKIADDIIKPILDLERRLEDISIEPGTTIPVFANHVEEQLSFYSVRDKLTWLQRFNWSPRPPDYHTEYRVGTWEEGRRIQVPVDFNTEAGAVCGTNNKTPVSPERKSTEVGSVIAQPPHINVPKNGGLIP